MDIRDVNINNINSLTPEELAAVKRQGMRNLAGFVLFKVVLFTFIAVLARNLRKRAEKL